MASPHQQNQKQPDTTLSLDKKDLELIELVLESIKNNNAVVGEILQGVKALHPSNQKANMPVAAIQAEKAYQVLLGKLKKPEPGTDLIWALS